MNRRARRFAATSVDEPGQDSFLDVVANIVGILIILVVVVGVRASRLPVSELPAASMASDQASAKETEASSIVLDVVGLGNQVQSVAREAELHRQSRDKMNLLVEAAEAEIAARRADLDHDDQADFDLRRSLGASQAELDRLLAARLAVHQQAAETVEIESLPTPIGMRAVDEGHFQLRSGRLAFIPVERLMRRMNVTEQQRTQLLQDGHRNADSVGPVDGFRLSYQITRFIESDLGANHSSAEVRSGAVFQGYFLPAADDLGETLEQALATDSNFRRTLASMNPKKTTIVLWTYQDSFAEFRELKRELFKLGYKTACRPRRATDRIGVSSRGTRSVGQ